MNNQVVRVGIVGKRGLSHAPGLRSLPGVQIAALCEADPIALPALAEQYAIPKQYARLGDMLEAVDAVVLATPMPLHVPQAVLALNAGKHVLSEVTAAVTLEECWRLLDAVRASGKTYMLAENYCFFRENLLIRQMVTQGLFGDLYYGEGEYLHEIRSYLTLPDGRPTWRRFWQVGLPGNTYATHSLGPVMQWFTAADPHERVESVVCMGSGVHTVPEYEMDDTSVTLCRLRSGKLIKIRLDLLSNRPQLHAYYALQGTAGVYEAARVNGEAGRVWIGKNEARDDRAWRPLSEFESLLPQAWRDVPVAAQDAGHGGGDYWVAHEFARAISGDGPPSIDVYAALEWTAVGLCSQLSAQNGGVPIRVPDFRDLKQRPAVLDAPSLSV